MADAVIHAGFDHDFSRFAENCEADRRAIEAIGDALEGSDRPLIITAGIPMVSGRPATEDDPPSTGAVTVSAASTNACLAKLGLGLVQVPRYRVAHELETGALVEVLAAWPPTPSPVYLLYPDGRQLSPRVRLFIDWAAAEVARGLERELTGNRLHP